MLYGDTFLFSVLPFAAGFISSPPIYGQAIIVQQFARMAIWKPKWRRLRVIPVVIQRFVRGHLARCGFVSAKRLRYIAEYRRVWYVYIIAVLPQ